MSNVKTTIDHTEIRDWVEKHHGKPVILDLPDAKADKIGLRIDFPGRRDEAFLGEGKKGKVVGWDKFFEVFEAQKLAFTYEINIHEKDLSLAYEFIRREKIR